MKTEIQKKTMLSTKLKSFDTFVINATTPFSVKLSFTGIGLIVIPKQPEVNVDGHIIIK